jgi:hypothetical protein
MTNLLDDYCKTLEKENDRLRDLIFQLEDTLRRSVISADGNYSVVSYECYTSTDVITLDDNDSVTVEKTEYDVTIRIDKKDICDKIILNAKEVWENKK